ncbi:cytochrome C oxidase copper chaperone-domain-containing protein [Paraphysoderma sedebokerense]|nr:cytochrome C oxidase copper chaperone-domain-containing protein [Paraphysoderma sedebokerense]
MGNSQSANSPSSSQTVPSPSPPKPTNPDGTPLKPCCACPETKKLRDECVLNKGEENCKEFIEKHKECLRSFGFKV